MDEIVFDPNVLKDLDGKDLRLLVSAKDDHSCVLTATIAQPGNGAVIAVLHSQVLRAGSEISFRVPLAVKVAPELRGDAPAETVQPKRKRTTRKKVEKADQEE